MSFLEPGGDVLFTDCVFFQLTVWYSFIQVNFSEIFLLSVQKQKHIRVSLLTISWFTLFPCVFWDDLILKGWSENFFAFSCSKMHGFLQSLPLPSRCSLSSCTCWLGAMTKSKCRFTKAWQEANSAFDPGGVPAQQQQSWAFPDLHHGAPKRVRIQPAPMWPGLRALRRRVLVRSVPWLWGPAWRVAFLSVQHPLKH